MSMLMTGNMLIMHMAEQLEEVNKENQRLRDCMAKQKKSMEETVKLAEAARRFLKKRSINIECTSCAYSPTCTSSVLVTKNMQGVHTNGDQFRLPVTSCSAGVLKCKTKKNSSRK